MPRTLVSTPVAYKTNGEHPRTEQKPRTLARSMYALFLRRCRVPGTGSLAGHPGAKLYSGTWEYRAPGKPGRIVWYETPVFVSKGKLLVLVPAIPGIRVYPSRVYPGSVTRKRVLCQKTYGGKIKELLNCWESKRPRHLS